MIAWENLGWFYFIMWGVYEIWLEYIGKLVKKIPFLPDWNWSLFLALILLVVGIKILTTYDSPSGAVKNEWQNYGLPGFVGGGVYSLGVYIFIFRVIPSVFNLYKFWFFPTLISIVLVIVGIYLINKNEKETKETSMDLIKSITDSFIKKMFK